MFTLSEGDLLRESVHRRVSATEVAFAQSSVSRLAGGIPYRYGLMAGRRPLYPQGEEFGAANGGKSAFVEEAHG
jgi:hypothetical protein